MRMANDPAVSSVEYDCYSRADPDVSLLKNDDSSPGAHDTTSGLYEVGRKLSVQVGAPWGIDRIDTNGRPIDNNYDDGDLTGKGVRVYIVDTGVQGSHDDFGGRVVNGHTVRAHQSPPTYTPTARHPPTSYNTTRPSTPRPPDHRSHHPRHPLPSSFPPRRPASTPSATRAKLSTASSPLTALGAKGTAPTWPRPSAA